jgi:hypothetical protein
MLSRKMRTTDTQVRIDLTKRSRDHETAVGSRSFMVAALSMPLPILGYGYAIVGNEREIVGGLTGTLGD